MARPQNKVELVEFAQNEYGRLMKLVNLLTPQQRDEQAVFDNRTAKDIVAHLLAWQLLELTWYEQGMTGAKPAIPAVGYTFKDAPALNEKLYQDYKNTPWDKLSAEFAASHGKLLTIINGHSQEELFTKKKYAWTGSTDMAIYFRSALSSHYVWAIDLIRKHFKIKV